MRIEFSAATDVGRKRKHNEDNYLADADLGLYVVCDGMGGHAAGEVASEMATTTIREVVAEHHAQLKELIDGGGDPREAALEMIEGAVQLANRRIHTEASENAQRRGMGTTVSAMVVLDGRAYVGHVGDSRIYLLRGDQIHQVTTDHTVVNKMIRAGRLKPEDAGRVKYTNALTRAVGVYERVEVETLDMDVLPGDMYLLCSDGLHGYFHKLDVKAFLTHLDVKSGAKEFITFANRSGGKDNITAILLKAAAAGETQQTMRIRLTISTLREIPLFQYLSFSELLRVITVCRTREIPKDTPVIRAGDMGNDFFILLDGEVRVHNGDQDIAVLDPGCHFGEMSLIDNNPRSASVTTTENSVLIRIGRQDFYNLLRDDSVMAVKLLWNFIQTLSMMVRRQNLDTEVLDLGQTEDIELELEHPYGS